MAVKDVRPAVGRSRRFAAVQWWAALGVLFLILQFYTVAASMLRGEATPTHVLRSSTRFRFKSPR